MSTSGNSSSSAGFPRPATAHPGGSSSGGGYQQPRQPPSYTKPFAMSGSSSGMDDAAFTQEMRDRQARGKDPDGSEGSDLSDRDTGDTPAKLRLGRADEEDFPAAERRQKAVAFLDSPELLMMYSQSTGDSIPGARLHFMKMLCGYDDESIEESRKSTSYHPSYHGQHHYHHQQQQRQHPTFRDTEKRRGGDRGGT